MASHSLDLELSSSQFASIADGSQTGLSLTGDLTLECWVKFESLPSGGGLATFISQDDYAVSRGYYFGLYDDSGTLKLRLGKYVGGTMRFPMVAWTPNTGVWYHIAVTRASSSGDTKFYVNGSQQGTTQSSTSGAIQDSTVPFRLGAVGDTGNAANFYDGLIKEVRVWNAVRTEAQIGANAGKEIGTDTNLKGYWKLNNDYADASGNGNTLTASGSPTFSTDRPWVNATGISGSTYLETNLRAYYRLESNANDDTANAYNLTTAGTPTFGAGKKNNGMDLGSSNSTKKATLANNLGVTGGACSVAVWVKVNTAPSSGNYQDIVYQIDGTNHNTNRIYYWNDAGTLKLTFGRDKLGSGGNEITITKTLTVGTWYLLTYSYDGTTLRGFINNQMVGATAASGAGSSGGSNGFFLGVNSGGSSNWASVMLDEGAVYSRGLHYGDVLDLYNEGNAITWTGVTNVTADAGVLAATFAAQAPAASGKANTTASVGSATFSVPASSVSGGASTAASVLTATFSLPLSSVFLPDAQVEPSALELTLSIPAATATGKANVEASLLEAALSILEVTVTGEINLEVTASVLTATFSVQTPRKSGGAWTPQPRTEGVWTPQPRTQG